MNLTNENYFSPEAMREYWSVSAFKSFSRCEACGLAEVKREYKREVTDALLIGSYVDAHFSGEMTPFMAMNGDKMFKKNGELLAKFEQANRIIEAVENQPLMMEFLTGDKQTVLTADLFGVPWKGKLDVLTDKRIVDLKCVKDFNDIYDPGYGYRSWIEYWGYDSGSRISEAGGREYGQDPTILHRSGNKGKGSRYESDSDPAAYTRHGPEAGRGENRQIRPD
jgi:hypothetical protein